MNRYSRCRAYSAAPRVAQMSKQATVDVFYGHPLVVKSEIEFLGRLRRDLVSRGVAARVLANLEAGRSFQQLDFVIVTEHRAVLCELKSFRFPVIGRANGVWHETIAGQPTPLASNPTRQARQGVYELSDTLHEFVNACGVPGPTKTRFYRDIDTVVCMYPAIPTGSQIEQHRYVTHLGYEELLDRLTRPGPKPPWSTLDWDALVRHLALIAEDDETERAQSRRANEAELRAYSSRFVSDRREQMPPVVDTKVVVEGQHRDRPNLTTDLVAGRRFALIGASEAGKTLWARQLGLAVAEAEHVPVWIQARSFDENFRTSLSRAIAQYTTLGPSRLFKTAGDCGRSIVVIVDGLNEATSAVREAIKTGVETLRLHAGTIGVVYTAQEHSQVPAGDGVTAVTLTSPDEDERSELLAAYGARDLGQKASAFTTPLELSLAAQCAGELGPQSTPTQLLDIYVNRVCDEGWLRAGLRGLAWRMHSDVRLSLSAPDAARMLQRELGLDAERATAVLRSKLTDTVGGRVTFRHERFAGFLAAEALFLGHPDPETLGASLNEPLMASLRRDVLELEGDEARMGAMLAGLTDASTLTSAVLGKLGNVARRAATGLIVDALRIGCAQTASESIEYEPGPSVVFGDKWTVPWSADSARSAQQITAGQCLRHGFFVEEIARLVDLTDSLCARLVGADSAPVAQGADHVFAATYATGRPLGEAVLPASRVVGACREAAYFERRSNNDSENIAITLLTDCEEPGQGRLYLACSLLVPLEATAPLLSDVVAACLENGAYHLRLEALQLVERAARVLDEPSMRQVVEYIEALPDGNLFVDTAAVEALAALGAISPGHDLDEIVEEIRTVLTSDLQQTATQKRAAGIVSWQFEEEDVVGPYYEAVLSLDEDERQKLLALALRGGTPSDMFVNWIIQELDTLDNPMVRAAVIDFVAGSSHPRDWHSIQFGLSSLVVALRLIAQADLPLPPPTALADSGWRSFVALVYELWRREAGLPSQFEGAWRELLSNHSELLADLLANYHTTTWLSEEACLVLQRALLDTIPPEGVETLVWSLENPDRLSSCFAWPREDERSRCTMILLGQIGDQQAADAMRSFVADPELGETAVKAIREIEARFTQAKHATS